MGRENQTFGEWLFTRWANWCLWYVMDVSGGDRDFGFIELRLARLLLDCGQLQGFAVGVSDPEPWRRIGVAVTARSVVWIDAQTATAVSVTRDAITRVAFLAFDAPPRPIYFDVEIDTQLGIVSIAHPESVLRQAVGSARSALVHRWIDTVRFTTSDAQQLERALRRQPTDDYAARLPGKAIPIIALAAVKAAVPLVIPAEKYVAHR